MFSNIRNLRTTETGALEFFNLFKSELELLKEKNIKKLTEDYNKNLEKYAEFIKKDKEALDKYKECLNHIRERIKDKKLNVEKFNKLILDRDITICRFNILEDGITGLKDLTAFIEKEKNKTVYSKKVKINESFSTKEEEIIPIAQFKKEDHSLYLHSGNTLLSGNYKSNYVSWLLNSESTTISDLNKIFQLPNTVHSVFETYKEKINKLKETDNQNTIKYGHYPFYTFAGYVYYILLKCTFYLDQAVHSANFIITHCYE